MGVSRHAMRLLLFCYAIIGLQCQTTNKLEDNGGHYRYANIRWQRVTGNTVLFTLESAWRRDYGSTFWLGSGPDNFTVAGDIIALNGKQWPILSFGDDMMMVGEYLKLTVEAYSITENWVYGTSTISHSYANINNKGVPWIVTFTGCCKISPVNDLDSKDMPWQITTLVDLSLDSASPRILAMPVYSILNTNITRIRWEREDAFEFPPTIVSFYVPGFHPNGRKGVQIGLADKSLWDNHAALYGTLTPIDASVDSDTGKISLHFPAISTDESADSSWSLPGVKPLGMFYFIKVNASIAGLVVQCDFLLRIEMRDIYMPRISFGVLDLLNLPPTPSLDTLLAPLQLPSQRPRFYPNGSYVIYTGFGLQYTIAGYVMDGLSFNPTRRLVGFGVQGLPLQARLSTVEGQNPSAMKFSWIPCANQNGQQITCYEAVESTGNASMPECVNVIVLTDPPPAFYLALDIDEGDTGPGRLVNMSSQSVYVTLGARKEYTVTAYDLNCQDSLLISVSGSLPPGAALGSVMATTHPYPDKLCPAPSVTSAVNITLTWLAPYTFGGNVTTICFVATDSCGGCSCAGGADSTVQCVDFRVTKCRYSVGNEHQLSEVAFIYGTNWLQLWKMNPSLLHPDNILFKSQSIDIGRLLSIGLSDTLSGLAARYGSSLQSIYDLNNDLKGSPNVTVGTNLCIIPNSCQGQYSGEASQAGLSSPAQPLPQGPAYLSSVASPAVYACSSSSNTNGLLYASQSACNLQCLNLDGGLGSCVSAGP